MHNHALPLRELHRQELLAEAEYERRLDHLDSISATTKLDVQRGMAELRHGVANFFTSLRHVPHLVSRVSAR